MIAAPPSSHRRRRPSLSARRSRVRLLPGVVALIAIAALAVSVLVFARIGGLRGSTYRLYAIASDARGIIKGTDVWLAGRKVGLVARVELGPVSSQSGDRVLLELEVLKRHQPLVRSDSRVRIRSGGNLLGAPVVAISMGTPAGHMLADGDTLSGISEVDLEELTSELAIASQDLPQIIDNADAIRAHVLRAREDIGALGANRSNAALEEFRARVTALTARAKAESGAWGRILEDTALSRRARRVTARADSLLRLLASADGTVRRGRRDTSLPRALTDLRADVAIIRRQLAEARGSAGRFARDGAIALQVERLQHEIDSTLADVKRQPARYLPF
jgi:phospholipid/cholesterol/gamma-HCH transport system substrate-binding protein